MGHGGMGCGMKTMRFVMVVFNILFFLIGLALLALGIYVLVDPSLQLIKKVLPISNNPAIDTNLSSLKVPVIFVVVLGSILVIIGFLGCFGAMKQVKVFLTIYAIIIGIIILFEIAITIYFVAFKSQFEAQIEPKLIEAVQNTYQGPLGLLSNTNVPTPSAISIVWDFIMYYFQCCGVEGKDDFNGTKIWSRTNIWWNSTMGNASRYFTYPLTCCNISNGFTMNWNSLNSQQLQSASSCAIDGINIYQDGCFDKFMNLIDDAKTWIIIGAVLILVIELAIFSCAIALCCRKKKNATIYPS